MRYFLLLAISTILGICSYHFLQIYREPQLAVEVGPASEAAPTTQLEQPSPTPSEILADKISGAERTANVRAFENGLPLAARVNDQPLYLDIYERRVAQFERELKAKNIDLTGEVGPAALAQIEQQILDDLLNQLIIEQQAQILEINMTDEQVEAKAQEIITQLGDKVQLEAWLAKNGLTYEALVADLRAQLIANQLFERVTQDVSSQVEQIRLRYIRVAEPELGQAIIEQLKTGADFAALAQTQSLDKNRGAHGGDLGWLPQNAGLLPEAVEEIAFSLQPGEVSGPIQTSQGFYIIRLEARESERLLTSSMLQLLKKQIFSAWLQEKRASALIEQYVTL